MVVFRLGAVEWRLGVVEWHYIWAWGGGFRPIILENYILRYDLKENARTRRKIGPKTKIYT